MKYSNIVFFKKYFGTRNKIVRLILGTPVSYLCIKKVIYKVVNLKLLIR